MSYALITETMDEGEVLRLDQLINSRPRLAAATETRARMRVGPTPEQTALMGLLAGQMS